mgnify:CR=1 FL=1
MPIDSSAIVHESAKIHKDAVISAYALVGANVEIGAGTVIDSHAVIEGPTKIGKNNHIYSFASIGGCLLYTSPSPRDGLLSRMPSSA